ncbi:MAG TPA: DUF6265 family protein [Burkholderiaceae bacterium]|nr:DUF6265 family protein [Burkholderiaceae bacterium]
MRALAACVMVLAATPLTAAPLDELGWLAGCWTAERGDSGSAEMWMAAAGASVLGMSRTVRSGRTVAHEFMQIVDGADGLTFIAMPSAKAPASFRAIRVEPRRVVFENPDKDFPQRVIYESPDDATLIGHIEGRHDGRDRRVDFPMKRAACPGSAR